MFCSFMPVFSSIRKRRRRPKCNENISNMFACGSQAFFSLEGRVGGLYHGLMFFWVFKPSVISFCSLIS